MPLYEVTSPDGKKWEINAPEGATQEQALAYAKQQWSQQTPTVSQPAAVKAGEVIKDSIPRQAGLFVRSGIEGLGQLAEIGAEPIRQFVTDPLARLFGATGARGRPLSREASHLADVVGLPKPEGANERVIAEATKMMAGAGGMAGLSGKAAQGATGVTQKLLQSLAANPGSQLASAGGAGLAGGAVRESGGGPGAQFAASLAGGLAGPGLLNLAQRGAQSVTAGAKAMAGGTKDLDARLSFELGKAGVNWEDLGAAVKMKLREDAKKAVYSNQPIDTAALRRLADFRNIGATPMLGDITLDPNTLTQQRNLAKQMANMQNPGPTNLPNLQNQNARRVLETLEGATSSADDQIATGQRIIDSVTGRDAVLKAQERALYGAAQDQLGRNIQIDRGAFLNEAYGNLAKANKLAFLPDDIGKLLDQLGSGTVKAGGQEFPVPFDVDAIDNLKTMLSAASRGSKNGNEKAAIAAVRNALENVQPKIPEFGGNQLATPAQAAALRSGDPAAQAMEAFDKARGFARDRRQWQESASFIEDALDGAAPDKFVQKHIIGGTVDDLTKLRAEIGSPPMSAGRELVPSSGPAAAGPAARESAATLESVRKQMVDYIMQRGGADSDVTTFSSKAMKDALKQIGDRKLALFFSPQEIQQLKSAVNVGRYMQAQPIGSAVNNSNSAAMLMGRLSSALDTASGIPFLGPMVSQPLQGGLLRMQARGMSNISRGLLQPQESAPLLNPALGLLALPALQPMQNQ